MQMSSRWTARGLLGVGLVALSFAAPQVASADVTVEGPFADLAGTTIDGTEVYDVTVCPGDRFYTHVAFEEVGAGYVWQYWIPPLLASRASTDCAGWTDEVDTTELSEGTHTFRGSVDYGDEVSDTFTVTIDR